MAQRRRIENLAVPRCRGDGLTGEHPNHHSYSTHQPVSSYLTRSDSLGETEARREHTPSRGNRAAWGWSSLLITCG